MEQITFDCISTQENVTSVPVVSLTITRQVSNIEISVKSMIYIFLSNSKTGANILCLDILLMISLATKYKAFIVNLQCTFCGIHYAMFI